MANVIFALAVDIAVIAIVVWVIVTLARLRRDQRALFAEVERMGHALGVPPREVPMVRCPRCEALYRPELTGCPNCGAAKPHDATPILTAMPASQHAVDVLPPRRR